MRTITVAVHYDNPLRGFPDWVNAFAFGRNIYFRKPKEQVGLILMNHELIHVCQFEEHGLVKFLFQYFIRELRTSYRRKSFEREAFENESNLSYLSQRWPEYEITIVEKD
jgi:hypothetical protein